MTASATPEVPTRPSGPPRQVAAKHLAHVSLELESFIAGAQADGARLLSGGGRPTDRA